jgi:hypothetical protein
MHRSFAILLLAGCATWQLQIQGWAQAPSAQKSAEQAPPAEQKSANQNHLPEQTPQTPDNHTDVPASPPEQAAATQPAQTGFPLDRFKEFSAIMTRDLLLGGDWEGHIYRSGNLMRMEGREQRNYLITDLVKQETHGVAAPGCLKLDYPYTRSFPFYLTGSDKKYEHIPVGEETVDGHVCRVEDVIISFPKRPPAKLRFWEAEDLQGFPVKIELRTTNIHRSMEYKNVVLGPQDPTLFVYPNQCQELMPDVGSKHK